MKKDKTESQPKQYVAVDFEYRDGKKVTRGPGGTFNLRCPFNIRLPKGAIVKIDLGLNCSHPVVVFETKAMIDQGIEMTSGAGVWDAGRQLVVELKYTALRTEQEWIALDEGTTVARCAVLDNSHVLLEV
jgi:hypothetical protein